MTRALPLTSARLRALAPPSPDERGSKEERGRVLVAGGARETPGALLLAGTAALRAGAGKLRLATAESVALAAAIAIPEARLFPLAETKAGGISPEAAGEIVRLANAAGALLLGPGIVEPDEATALARAVLAEVDGPAVVLDAGCLPCLADERGLLHHLGGRAVITPHAGEMAGVMGMEKEEVEADPLAVARRAARELGAAVALKGPDTIIAAPDGRAYRYAGGQVGLATSGSGDVLAGLVAGLLARGADAAGAAAWGVWLHGEAGNALARRVGRIGFLARELPAEVPRLLQRLA
ncbi:NAD(P)H-hydrate dehydratase [Longimicrobium sp.]|uniref:NAD(P)H-hydrate dehydratase n=1 Tax=Longimicrobium sp. TaxID=2029185 RepID=UPI002D162DA2|nr:NAD(P)H-hydrate dehydratase [Longimicrobium sp.]HSU17686.1 NAD(P)H-hydrate dehydratase [Longimicrobium sp.]